MAIVSRLLLDHPAHNTAANGTALHESIEALYVKIGDMMNSRFFTEDALANTSSINFEHNFKVNINELRYVLYERDTITDELTRLISGGTPDLDDFTIAATTGDETTHITVTNNTGGAVDIALLVVHGKGAEVLADLSDIDFSTPPTAGQVLAYNDGTGKWEPTPSAASTATVGSAGIIELQWTGYTKFVGGSHPDAYASLTAALAAASAGDSILVMASYSSGADETISVSDIKITFMPNVAITATGGTDALVINAARVNIVGARYIADFTGTLNSFMRFSSNARDCNVEMAFLEANDAGVTVTQAIDFDASSARNSVKASMLATAGAISAPFVDAGTDNDPTIRG